MSQKPQGMVDCPIGGCNYRGSIEQVKGHWGGMQDGEHQGKFHEAYEAYNEARGGTQQAREPPTEQAGANSPGGEGTPHTPAQSAQGGGTKLDLSALTQPDEPEEPDGCPECGDGDYYAAEAVLEKFGGKLGGEERKALNAHERVCVECGEVYG